MKSSKLLYSTCFEEYKLNDFQIKNLQNSLLSMFLDFKQVCDENSIDYMMSGGTLLGTIRHKGFIAWDDDIDIMMLRSEYEKFRKIFVENLSDKYILAEPLSTEKYFSKMPKIFKKGTTYVEIPTAGVNSLDMLFIDVFIIENIPNPKMIQKIKAKIYNFAFKGSSVCIDYLFPSPVILEKSKTNAELAEYYNFRRKIGFVFSHLGGINFYLKICEKLSQSKNESKYLGVPSAISYEREILPREVFTELTTGIFCGYEVKIPANYDRYLRNLYGNYMEIPPVEKRESHVAYKIEL
ncbi:LicD family protein [Clostridium paraputrificum]|uniref:LicD family protein n=1 Tax=Clostridium paraputrificum TaxID=29363 RepID=UPI003D32E6A4